MHESKLFLTKLILLALFFLTIFLYINSLCPTISWRDSPEFVTVSYNLDISHPAGSPTYSLFSKLLSFIPIGNIPLRANLFSALSSSLCIVMVFVLLHNFFHYRSITNKYISCIVSILSLFTCNSHWNLSLISEVYAFQNFFLVLLLIILMKSHHSMPALQLRYQYIFVFLYGLSLGVHATMAIFAPVFTVFFFDKNKNILKVKTLIYIFFFFLLGFLTYVYLPLRSLSQIAYDWGNPETFNQFLNQILNKKDSAREIYKVSNLSLLNITTYIYNLRNEFPTILLVIGVIGFAKLTMTQFRIAMLCSLVFLAHTTFFLHLGWSVSWGYIPSFVILSLFIASGFDFILSLPNILSNYLRSGGLSATVKPIIQLSIIFSLLIFLVESTKKNTKSEVYNDYSAKLIAKKIISELPLDSILFTNYTWFPLLYLQHIEHRRPDLTFILQAEAFFSKYFETISQQRFPNIKHPAISSAKNKIDFNFFWTLVDLNASKHPLFWESNMNLQDYVMDHINPYGILFSLDPQNIRPINNRSITRNSNYINDLAATYRDMAQNTEATLFITDQISSMANFWSKLQHDSQVINIYNAALNAWPEEPNTNNNYGNYLMSKHRMTMAAKYLDKALETPPHNVTTYKNLARLMFKTGNYKEALYFQTIFKNSSKRKDMESEALLGAIHYEIQDYDSAVKLLNSSLEMSRHEYQPINRSEHQHHGWIALYRELAFEGIMNSY